MSQGANPWSDVGCEQALRLVGRYLQRAVDDAADTEARSQMMYAATLAGIAFGNSGVHIPHGMSYSVAGLVREFKPAGYPQKEPMVPHGMSVIVNAPAAFQFTAQACPERHLRGAELLGAEPDGVDPADAGVFLSQHLVNMMRAAGMPNGVGGVGYSDADVGALAEGAFLQQRLLKNAPCATDQGSLAGIYRNALRYW
jgi:alcohol dehydrogenase class IV